MESCNTVIITSVYTVCSNSSEHGTAKATNIHTHTHIHTYIYICVCVWVCMYVSVRMGVCFDELI